MTDLHAFLDVDGVVNCWPSPSFEQLMASQAWRDGKAYLDSNGRTYTIWWQEWVPEYLNSLARDRGVKFQWLTTWTASAPKTIAPLLGLDDWPAITERKGGRNPGLYWWKWRRVQEFLDANPEAHALWIDDDIEPWLQDEAKVKYGNRICPIQPATNPAFSQAEVELVEAYLASL